MPPQPQNPLKPTAPAAPAKGMPAKAAPKGVKLPVKKGNKKQTGQDFNFTGK